MNARNEAFDILANKGREALDILANKGRSAFVRHCTYQRDIAKATGCEGAAEFWQNLLDEVRS